jgi:hypothetical protein
MNSGRSERSALNQGPLLVDLDSFVRLGTGVLGEDLSSEDVREAVGGPVRDADEKSAVRCSGPSGPCYVRDEGFFIRLDRLARTPSGVEAVVTYMWTDRRGRGESAIGMSQLQLLLKKQENAEWVLLETRRLMTT